jgi:predicted DNA-binding protein YlxM (UPF0122 family)
MLSFSGDSTRRICVRNIRSIEGKGIGDIAKLFMVDRQTVSDSIKQYGLQT